MKCEKCGHVNERRKKTLPDADFDKFWKAYPRKTGKFLANKVWKAINGDHLLVQVILEAVNRQRRSADWQKDNGAYIPHASTWLNQKRWDDEVPENGKIVHQSANQDPLTHEKEKAAKDRLESIKEREFEKREKVRLAQERDDLRSQKMMKAVGDFEAGFDSDNLKKYYIPEEIKKCKDENGNKWIEEQERIESNGE